MTLEEMLQDLVAANRDAYERRNGEPITNPASFDLAFRKRKLADEEARPGSIERAWQNLTGNAPRRTATPANPPLSEFQYAIGLAVSLLATVDPETGVATWTDEEMVEMLIESDDLTDFVARRVLDAARPLAKEELENRATRRRARERLGVMEKLQREPKRVRGFENVHPLPTRPEHEPVAKAEPDYIID